MNIHKIETLYEVYYNTHVKIKKQDYVIPLMGMLNGNKILFIGQNPGMPFTKEQWKHFKGFTLLLYKEQQKLFKESWKQSKFLKYIYYICEELNIDFHTDCSVTNIVKYWTESNKRPEITDIDQKLLVCEISLLNPSFVVFLSKYAYDNFSYKDRIKNKMLIYNHPAAIYYNKESALKIAADIKGLLNGKTW